MNAQLKLSLLWHVEWCYVGEYQLKYNYFFICVILLMQNVHLHTILQFSNELMSVWRSLVIISVVASLFFYYEIEFRLNMI